MKPALGLTVNKLGNVFIIAWFPKVAQTTHISLTKTRSRTYTTPSLTPKNNPHMFV